MKQQGKEQKQKQEQGKQEGKEEEGKEEEGKEEEEKEEEGKEEEEKVVEDEKQPMQPTHGPHAHYQQPPQQQQQQQQQAKEVEKAEGVVNAEPGNQEPGGGAPEKALPPPEKALPPVLDDDSAKLTFVVAPLIDVLEGNFEPDSKVHINEEQGNISRCFSNPVISNAATSNRALSIRI
jgi:hypothetical protein